MRNFGGALFMYGAVALTGLILLLMLIAVSLKAWYKIEVIDSAVIEFGLWQYCVGNDCGEFDPKDHHLIQAARACAVLALISVACVLGLAACYICSNSYSRCAMMLVYLMLIGLFVTLVLSIATLAAFYSEDFVTLPIGFLFGKTIDDVDTAMMGSGIIMIIVVLLAALAFGLLGLEYFRFRHILQKKPRHGHKHKKKKHHKKRHHRDHDDDRERSHRSSKPQSHYRDSKLSRLTPRSYLDEPPPKLPSNYRGSPL